MIAIIIIIIVIIITIIGSVMINDYFIKLLIKCWQCIKHHRRLSILSRDSWLLRNHFITYLDVDSKNLITHLLWYSNYHNYQTCTYTRRHVRRPLIYRYDCCYLFFFFYLILTRKKKKWCYQKIFIYFRLIYPIFKKLLEIILYIDNS